MGIRRGIAFLADFLLVTSAYILIFFTLGINLFSKHIYANSFMIVLFYVLYLLVYIAYFCVLPFYWEGKTVFKRALSVKVVVNDRSIKVLLLLIVKYLVFRLALTILTFGLIVVADLIYMKRKDGVSFVDQLLGLKTVIV